MYKSSNLASMNEILIIAVILKHSKAVVTRYFVEHSQFPQFSLVLEVS